MSNTYTFSIGYVSHQTGLSTHVIRAWERRYAAVRPRRSDGGRRLYTPSDIARLALLKQLLDDGHRISTIADLDRDSLVKLIERHAAGRVTVGDRLDADGEPPDRLIDRCLAATHALDSDGLYRTLQEGLLHHSRQTFLDGVVRPFMHRVGRQWAEGSFRIVHGHLAAGVVHTLLNGMLNPCSDGTCGRPRMLIAAPAGQHCYLGALAVAVAAQDHGWRTLMTGPNLPAEEIAAACSLFEPQLIALSITCRVDDEFTSHELSRLAEMLDGRCRIVVGGQASRHYRPVIDAVGGMVCETAGEMLQTLTAS
jgi:MerR family transcriptional regulator, light-induced transcriptional regulator